MNHPLEDEELFVTVLIRHIPTDTIALGSYHSAADDGHTASQAVDEAKQKALDKLLDQLENQGG